MRLLSGASPLPRFPPVWDIPATWGNHPVPLPSRLGHPCHLGTFLLGAAAGLSQSGRKAPEWSERAGLDGSVASEIPGRELLEEHAAARLGDDGLDAALESLAAGAALPVELDYRLPVRPAPAVEAIAYYSAAELVTNAVKHSRGTGIWISVTGQDNSLFLSVTDNGSGGADPAAGTGLAGLAERVRTVDGALHISSPVGGPTSVTVSLPIG